MTVEISTIVWRAEFDCGAEENLGIYSTEDKARAACDKRAKCVLEWEDQRAIWFGNGTFWVWPVKVDDPDWIPWEEPAHEDGD